MSGWEGVGARVILPVKNDAMAHKPAKFEVQEAFREFLIDHDRRTLKKAANLIRGYGHEEAAKMVEEYKS